MNIRNEMCDLLDRGEKGHITIGDVGVATVHIAIMIAATYLVYCSIPIWQTHSNPIFMFTRGMIDFSVRAHIGYTLSWMLIISVVVVCCIFLLSKLEDISKIKIIKCMRKQK